MKNGKHTKFDFENKPRAVRELELIQSGLEGFF